ncbi:MAG: cobyric acid synthase [Deltaproteobacteria bacterium]|nr:cobyric acid synthase [Deltaproteobacteria bacterium]
MVKAIMVMGTASDVGKSVVVAGLCRIFHRAGIDVAPFKAQNMSLNSFVTIDGGEMGRAQVLQAEACGLPPHVDMNPILLKPEADNCSQVIVHGKVWGKFDAQSYFARHHDLFRFVCESYERLARAHDVIVIEGAGSAAEVNLRDKDIVNWPVANMADARVLLVADIERGGVFAQVLGTVDLLSWGERRRVIGIVVNKFRGDLELFADGVRFIESRARLPVLGVVPFLRDLDLDQEDSVAIERYRSNHFAPEKVNVAVVLLPHMSNFTDFNSLVAESDVALRYARAPAELTGADVVIIPGTKSTIADFDYLEQNDFRPALQAYVSAGSELVGICGGYQMLGREISDPFGVESGGMRLGFGFLNVTTELMASKTTTRIEAQPIEREADKTAIVRGYEIHMGRTDGAQLAPRFRILRRLGDETAESHNDSNGDADGAMTDDGRIWGTYIHGVFDQPGFRRHWLNQLRERKGLEPFPLAVSENTNQKLAAAMDRWADHLERHLELAPIFGAVNFPYSQRRTGNQVVTKSQS